VDLLLWIKRRNLEDQAGIGNAGMLFMIQQASQKLSYPCQKQCEFLLATIEGGKVFIQASPLNWSMSF
jgi:hypothetical protein